MISGSSNIALSFLLVERFQGLGIAVAFCVSYFVLMVVSYLINRFILKQYVPNVRLFVFPLVVLTFIYLIYYILDLGTYGLFVRILVFIFISCILLWKYFDYVMSAFKKI
jgi:O-antigen/teichoic acid export membrane protein